MSPRVRMSLLVMTAALAATPVVGAAPTTMTFQRVWEPNHQAFTMMIPRGWVFQGGLTYVNPLTQDPGQVMVPKCNFTVTSPDGQEGFEWYEETRFWSWGPTPPPAAPMLNQVGSYGGMPIAPRMDAATFIEQMVIPHRRQGMGLQVIERRPLPEAAQAYAQTLPSAQVALVGGQLGADAAILSTASPQRDERFLCLLGLFQMPGGDMMWSNPITCSWRSPHGQMTQWEPTFMIIFQSMQLNPRWVEQEILRQAQATRTLTGVQDAIAHIDADIAANRMATNAAIARQGQLNLLGFHTRRDPNTGQEFVVPNDATGVFVDPNTGEATYTTQQGADQGPGPEGLQRLE